MQQQIAQVRPLPQIMTQHLVDHAWQLHDVNVDHAALTEVMDNEEKAAQQKGTVVKEEQQLTGANIVDHGQGTLSSRIRQLAHDCTDVTLQGEFRALAEAHPTYPKIREEVTAAFVVGGQQRNQMFDYLESLGCTVAFDKANGKVSLGLNKGLLNKGFIEHSRLVDLRNKNGIDAVNGQFHNLFQEKEPVRHEPTAVEYKTFYLTLDVSKASG